MDIICSWRDAITDPPSEGWDGLARHKYSHGYGHGFHVWYASGEYTDEDGDVIMDVDSEWLDVTDEPAVPMAKVQAAVDEMDCSDYFGDENDRPVELSRDSVNFCIGTIRNHTGVTPSEVQ